MTDKSKNSTSIFERPYLKTKDMDLQKESTSKLIDRSEWNENHMKEHVILYKSRHSFFDILKNLISMIFFLRQCIIILRKLKKKKTLKKY